MVNDGSARTTSTARPRRISITAVNDAPTLAGGGDGLAITENGRGGDAVAGAAVTDPDNQTLAVGDGVDQRRHFAAGDVLAATTTGTSITASYNAATGTLTLTGTDTLAHYQQVLDSVTFTSRPATTRPISAPTPAGRSPGWSTTARSTAARSQTTTVSITAVGRRAGAHGGGDRVLHRERRAGDAVAGCGGERRRQPDARVCDGVDQRRHSRAGDVLAANAAGTSITASYNAATEVLTLTGNDTLAHYQQVLDSVTFASTSDNPTNFGSDTSRTITWVVNDGALNNGTTQTTTVSITAVERRADAQQRGGERLLSPSKLRQ